MHFYVSKSCDTVKPYDEYSPSGRTRCLSSMVELERQGNTENFVFTGNTVWYRRCVIQNLVFTDEIKKVCDSNSRLFSWKYNVILIPNSYGYTMWESNS
jgi:hypothetical protein